MNLISVVSFRSLLEDWGPFIKLGIFGILTLCLSWFAFKGMVYVAGM